MGHDDFLLLFTLVLILDFFVNTRQLFLLRAFLLVDMNKKTGVSASSALVP